MSTETGVRVRRPGAMTALAASSKWILLGIGLVFAIVPFIWMVSGSFRSESDLFGNPASLFPTSITLHGYLGVWEQLPFLRLQHHRAGRAHRALRLPRLHVDVELRLLITGRGRPLVEPLYPGIKVNA